MATPTKAALLHENGQLLESIEIVSERLAELELALEDTDWIRLSLEGATEFSNSGLRKIIMLARLAYLKNPLINRAVSVQAHYVFGQGMNVEGHPEELDAVVQAFLDHPKNKVELTSHQARVGKEVTLQLEANLFFVLFTNSSTGRVLIRTIPVDEILAGDIITNAEDAKEPWLYKRSWTQKTFPLTGPAAGQPAYSTMVAYYPDWRFTPPAAERPTEIGEDPVLWDQPVMHIKVGGLDGMRFGVPEVYSALDWAKAVTKDLERYATLRAALARWAHTLTVGGGAAGVAGAKAKLGTTLGTAGTGLETNPPPIAASTFVSTPDKKLEAMRTRDALPHPDEARRLGLMVSAGTGIPETMLFGDADVGNLATAKTLDRPTELKMLDRQTLWADVHKALLGYVALQAAKRANGPLEGVATVTTDEDGVATLDFGNDDEGKAVEPGFDVSYPAILERDVVDRVDAIVKAATLDGKTPIGTLDPRTAIGLLLDALGLSDDVDELLDELVPEGTKWEDLRPEPVVPPLDPNKALAAASGQPGQKNPVAEAFAEVRAALVRLVEVSERPAA